MDNILIFQKHNLIFCLFNEQLSYRSINVDVKYQ